MPNFKLLHRLEEGEGVGPDLQAAKIIMWSILLIESNSNLLSVSIKFGLFVGTNY